MSNLIRITQLNEEYKTATPSRQQEIVQEIIQLAPVSANSMIAPTQQLVEQLEQDLKTLKGEISNLDMEQYVQRVKQIQENIWNHTQQLKLELTESNFKQLEKLLDHWIKQ